MHIPNRSVEPYTLTVGVTEEDFPTPPVTAKVKMPSLIFVESIDTNTGTIAIGPAGVQADGSANAVVTLSPGKNGYLPMYYYPEIKAIAAAPGQTLLVSYMNNKFDKE